MTRESEYKVKIYYEDTDSGGVVYYANYLKFFERARSEMIYSFGLSNKKILSDFGVLIIVKSCNINYKQPAKFEDILLVKSKVKSISKTSFTMEQLIYRDKDLITSAEIVLVIVNEKGKPTRMPNIIEKSLAEFKSS